MSDRTTNLRPPNLMAAQAKKYVTQNEALRLFDGLLNLRRFVETAGRHAACWRHPATALLIASSLLTACATGGSGPGCVVCPPVVAYDQAERDPAAVELEALPEGAALVGMIADCAVLRARARACGPSR
ncbi:hypothetical protein [Paracoccus sp. SCSIO 75233]|uniref:hypothetical protein n=1 Tax=Paracoccus sp. SCSIO 75233 TaxID=3017782 RepID=UPI0022F1316A|nr:hypothetical protein [Paracoccus sp. SCSIO 75233]WBU53003.1 hypothetical protein PAF12_14490 [Paracoccus sp. SCSIO 75233]